MNSKIVYIHINECYSTLNLKVYYHFASQVFHTAYSKYCYVKFFHVSHSNHVKHGQYVKCECLQLENVPGSIGQNFVQQRSDTVFQKTLIFSFQLLCVFITFLCIRYIPYPCVKPGKLVSCLIFNCYYKKIKVKLPYIF